MALDRETMEAAVIGLTAKRDEIEAKIAEIRRQLGMRAGRAVTPIGAGASPRKHHTMSAAATEAHS